MGEAARCNVATCGQVCEAVRGSRPVPPLPVAFFNRCSGSTTWYMTHHQAASCIHPLQVTLIEHIFKSHCICTSSTRRRYCMTPPLMHILQARHVNSRGTPLLPAARAQAAHRLPLANTCAGCACAGLPGYNAPGEPAMYELPAVQPVVQPTPAAHNLALCCLQSFQMLLSCRKELPPATLQAVLAALAVQPVPQQAPAAPSRQQVSGCVKYRSFSRVKAACAGSPCVKH